MTTLSLTRPVPRRTATLSCQQVGGCSVRATVATILVISLWVAAALFCVWSRLQVVKEGYALSDLNKEIKGLRVEHERLNLAAASLRTPERLEDIARNRLGMQFPAPSQIRTVSYQGKAEKEAESNLAARKADRGLE